jgi:hypothetical protein
MDTPAATIVVHGALVDDIDGAIPSAPSAVALANPAAGGPLVAPDMDRGENGGHQLARTRSGRRVSFKMTRVSSKGDPAAGGVPTAAGDGDYLGSALVRGSSAGRRSFKSPLGAVLMNVADEPFFPGVSDEVALAGGKRRQHVQASRARRQRGTRSTSPERASPVLGRLTYNRCALQGGGAVVVTTATAAATAIVIVTIVIG